MVFVYPSPLAFYRKITQVSAFSWFCQDLWGFPGKKLPGPFTKKTRYPFDNINVINKI